MTLNEILSTTYTWRGRICLDNSIDISCYMIFTHVCRPKYYQHMYIICMYVCMYVCMYACMNACARVPELANNVIW